MTEVPSAADRTALESIVQRLAAAWNAGDAAAYAALHASDADSVNVRAQHLTGRAAIAAAHDSIFRSFYAGSTVRLVVQALRFLVPDVALLHVAATLDVPHGPLTGRHEDLISAVCTRSAAGWEIAAFHNTQAPDRAGAGSPPTAP
jgi:uncharacterized protein (TIGR02246 family)